MIALVLGLTGGIWWLQQQAALPALDVCMSLTGIGLGLFATALLGQKSALMNQLNNKAVEQKTLGSKLLMAARQSAKWVLLAIAGACLGFALAAQRAEWRLADELPKSLEGQDVLVTGVVATLPQINERGVRFGFEVESASAALPRRIMLSWFYPRKSTDEAEFVLPVVHAGERWRMTVRLHRPHGNANPHGFDYEAMLLEQGWRATGYVRPDPVERLGDAEFKPGYAIERLRERIRQRFSAQVGENAATTYPYLGVLTALTIGDQASIPAPQWQVFSQTGITHLISISGLHVTMLAALAQGLALAFWRFAVRRSWRAANILVHFPALPTAAVFGWLTAAAYVLLAGFAVPAQRTLYMLTAMVLGLWWRRELAARQILALALLTVLLIDPWAVNAAGFWLSFGAVAVLLFASAESADGSLRATILATARAQWAVTLGSIPALLALFQQFSLVSPLANLMAIPLVSFAVTPLALLATVPGLEFLLFPAHWLFATMMLGIDWLAGLPLAIWQQAAPPPWMMWLAIAGCAIALLPREISVRWLGLFAFLPLLSHVPPRPLAGVAQVRVLDVGQGLAVHVQTTQHDLLFDTGAAFSADADSGNRIIVPYLRAQGVRRLDTLLLSHADRDHAGGAVSVAAAIPLGEVMHSLPASDEVLLAVSEKAPVRRCANGQMWSWDNVSFSILHPPEDFQAHKSNAFACVLRIEAGGKVMLLTSDIEAAQESALVARHRGELAADVLTVPHHGSKTSSTTEFIAAVGAHDAVLPVGYRNRFGHPKQEIVDRYVAVDTVLQRTDTDGAVTVDLSAKGVTITKQRDLRQRYWHGR